MMSKPPYSIPTMDEIRAIPWNGLKVASTFSGAGGSCTGYRMAGYRVVWANEFVPAAQASYKANSNEHCYLDGRDIRKVTADEILGRLKIAPGELDLFDGSPPCQAFSTAGKREAGWGKGKKYEHGAVQCNEQLFDDYIRLLGGLMPRVFIAENVSGLIKGKAKGFFKEILSSLKGKGYRVKCALLDAQWLGVPQARQRVIFMGVRDDLAMDPRFPSPLPYQYTVKDALPWLTNAVHDTSGKFSAGPVLNKPSPAVLSQRSGTLKTNSLECQSGAYPKTWKSADKPSPAIVAGRTTKIRSVETIVGNKAFTPVWGPIGAGPSPTIMAGGAHGGSGSIRAGGVERKFTIAEVKRICGFPDDFVLLGSYSQQWERLGNSVPPVMMRHVAESARQILLAHRAD